MIPGIRTFLNKIPTANAFPPLFAKDGIQKRVGHLQTILKELVEEKKMQMTPTKSRFWVVAADEDDNDFSSPGFGSTNAHRNAEQVLGGIQLKFEEQE